MCPLDKSSLFALLTAALLFLSVQSNAEQSPEITDSEIPEEDDGPPLFNAVSHTNRRLLAPLPIEKIRAVSFGDSNQGKIVWRVEKSQLPWRGSYSFLGKPNNNRPTVLLSVFDANTGLKIAECQTPVTRTTHTGWREQLDQSFHWHRVNWELDSEALQCNTTADIKSIRSTIQSTDSDSFIVRISAIKGPRCIRNLYADDEELSDCPPRMKMHAFQSEHLTCECPTNETSTETGLETEEGQSAVHEESPEPIEVVASEDPTTTTEDAPIFGNVRRKPLPGKMVSPDTAEEITGSVEITAPAFPMFQFTSSMEKSESETTPGSPSSAPTETTGSHQQEQVTERSEATPEDNGETTIIPIRTDSDCECQNNGTCVESSKGKRECKCPEGFGGHRCEKDLCAELGCQNGEKCQVRNGRAVCSCPSGVHGEKCRKAQATTTQQQAYCNPKCENGGVCSLSQNGPTCRCPHGFLGSNCNLRDMCAINTTCEAYGQQARCFKDVAELTKYSPILHDAAYSCQCPTGNGYVECNSTMNSRSVEIPTSSAEPLPPETISTSMARASHSSEMSSHVEGGGQSEEFPQQSFGPTIQQVIGTRPDPSSTPQFPLTSLSSTHSSSFQPVVTTMRILPRPSSTPASIEVTVAEFPRVSISSISPTITTTQTPTSKASVEEFDRLTNVFETTTDGEVDQMGPKHSMEGHENGETEVQPEFRTVGTSETSTITTTLIKNATVAQDSIERHSVGSHQESLTITSNWTWIIALTIVGVLLISATIGSLFMARYVKRSRRLHGKYNPAREENATAPATYALPVTSVNKDERLI